jgi:2,4-dienoyl-CoA reductase-like NADH-dependent reductase (Old Yellow Enzyme family)
MKEAFKGVLIANQNLTRDASEQLIAKGEADAVAFGRDFIATPDLPWRMQQGVALNVPRPEYFYGYGQRDLAVGYTDYPAQ